MRSTIANIEDLAPADHITDWSNHHWLVESVNIANSTFIAFYVTSTVKKKEVKWSDKLFRIQYPNSNDSSHVLEQAQSEMDRKIKWDSSDRFITKMKWGKSFHQRC